MHIAVYGIPVSQRIQNVCPGNGLCLWVLKRIHMTVDDDMLILLIENMLAVISYRKPLLLILN